MRQFKKNIFKKRTSDVALPPSFFSFSGTKGNVYCNNGITDINNTSPYTVYSVSSNLSTGVAVFDDSNLTIPTTILGFKRFGIIYEISAGIIDITYSENSPC